MTVDGTTMAPRLQKFPNGTQEVGKPAVRYGVGDTVYLALIQGPRSDGTILVRIIVQPLVAWLWAGGLLMLVGTALSAFPGGRRRGTEPTSAPAAWGPTDRPAPDDGEQGSADDDDGRGAEEPEREPVGAP